jgi:cbb3-type cytochrome oxidase subunit 3
MNSAPHSTAPREKSIWPMFTGAFVLFALFAAFVAWMLRAGDPASYDEEAIRAKERYEILAKIDEENTALITGYGWADQAKGTVRVPLDRAMELAVAKLVTQGEPRPAYPVDPNVPLGSAVKPGGFAAAQPTPPPFNAPAVAPESETDAEAESAEDAAPAAPEESPAL